MKRCRIPLFVLPLLLFVACDEQSAKTLSPLGPAPASSLSPGQIRMTATLPKASSARVRPGDVVSMIVEINWSGGGTAPIEMFETGESQFAVTVLNLPAGIPVNVQVFGRNEAGDNIYSGVQTGVILSETEIVDVNIVLRAVDDAIFEGRGPAITAINRPTEGVLANSIIQFEVQVAHPDDGSLSYELSGPGAFAEPTGSIDVDGDGTLVADYTAPAAPGFVTLSVRVTDSAGLSAQAAFSLEIIEPAGGNNDGGATIGAAFPPAILGVNAEQDVDNNVIRLTANVEDVGNALPLSFEWRVTSGTFSTENPAEYPANQGIVSILLVVGNAAGGSTKLVFQLDTSATTLGDLPLPNQPPTIEAALISRPEISYPEPAVLRVYARDPNAGDDLSAVWTTDRGSISSPTEFVDGAFEVFECTWLPDVTAGAAHVQVTVSDPSQASVIYTFNINQILGRVPVNADAGSDLEIFMGDTVVLDGTASTSDDGTIESYLWERLSGPVATIDTPGAATTNVSFDGGAGTYVFRLTVGNVNNTDTDTVTVSVIDPLAFDYSKSEMTDAGVAYFFNSVGRTIHRYDLPTETFLSNITVDVDASKFAVAPAGDVAYVGYIGGRIEMIDTATGVASLFTSTPTTPIMMKVVDNYLWTIDSSGSWETHRLFRRTDGVETFSDDWRNSSQDGVYAPSLSRVFHFRDGTSPNDIIYADVDLVNGSLGVDQDSPYHGDYSFQHPMRLSTDESKIMVASGVLFNTSNLTYAGSIGFSYKDARFYGASLYVLQSSGSGSQVRELDAAYNEANTYTMSGAPRSLFVSQGKILAVTNGANNRLNFTVISID